MSALPLDFDQLRGRLLQDMLSEATAMYRERRAAAFELSAPRPGDFNGAANDIELQEAARRCRAVALACRRHAQLLRDAMPEPISPEVEAALGEVAA